MYTVQVKCFLFVKKFRRLETRVLLVFFRSRLIKDLANKIQEKDSKMSNQRITLGYGRIFYLKISEVCVWVFVKWSYSPTSLVDVKSSQNLSASFSQSKQRKSFISGYTHNRSYIRFLKCLLRLELRIGRIGEQRDVCNYIC